MSPSPRSRPTWCRATPTTRRTCSCATGSPARRPGSASTPADGRRRRLQPCRRGASAPTAATSPSTRSPPTWCRENTICSPDVFVHDRSTGATTRVSLATGGGQANGPGFEPAIQRTVATWRLDSVADNLVTGDRNGVSNVFVSDRRTGATNRVKSQHQRHPSQRQQLRQPLSADGRVVAYYSFATNLVARDTNGKPDVFVRNRMAGTTTRVSVASDGTQGDDASNEPAVSADGRDVAFQSSAPATPSPDDTNRSSDIFVRDRTAQVTTRSAMATGAGPGRNSYQPVLSCDGRPGAFTRSPPTWCPGTRTVGATCSCATARRARQPGQRRLGRPSGQRRQRPRLAERGWPLGCVLLLRRQPGPLGHHRDEHVRRVRS